ncbi:uncharacterized protein LOC114527851 [Dendronephthya gigantea]|uniref:uncharacterized protein LOC114527851 n=1 Tax=Dendronephthya gigantea TaxID=151771 RepID=UPI00106A9774|nr:uncharacterized protein LOC114527851 [Dendronephthya gigantea]
MLSQIKQNGRCGTLESPRKLYDSLLLNVYGKIGEREKDVFEFSFRNDLSSSDLESRNPLKWFRILERRGKLSWTDVESLVHYLKEASLDSLASQARHYQARVRVIKFFQRYLQESLPGIRLDDKLNDKWCSEENLPKHYLKRCQELLRGAQDYDISLNYLRSLFSKGMVILVKSCSTNDSQSACFKLLYLADLFYQRFKGVIVADKELLNIKPLSSGKFVSLDGRGRTPVVLRRRSSVQVEVFQQFIQRRGLHEFNMSFTVLMCVILPLAGLVTSSVLGMISK